LARFFVLYGGLINAGFTTARHHQPMVVRRRFRRFVIPVAFWCLAGALSAFFISQAQTGRRGLENKERYEAEMARLEQELAGIKIERADWERRVAMFRADHIDRDLLEEQARRVLGRVHRNDVVIMDKTP
jgi:cell division protein FtsB